MVAHQRASTPDESDGRTIADRYQLTRQLGSGGMGRVWLAWDERLRRHVAVKEVLPRHSTEDNGDDQVRRTLREARAAAMLDHPGIITVHDVLDYDGRPWIIMEFIDGPSLADHLRDEGPLPVRGAAEIAIEVIGALDAAHGQGVLHRDVKPSNIMLGKGRVVLTDFGIAAVDGSTVLTATGQLVGSPEYLAPERIDGRGATRAADLWSVGITLYHMVIGDTPFRRTTTLETFGAIANSEPKPHPGLGPLWPVVQDLLRKKPEERLVADAAIDQLREVLGQRVDPSLVLPASARNLSPTKAINTATDVTADNTRHAAPAIPPAGNDTVTMGLPGDETLDPVPSPAPRSRPSRSRRRTVAVSGIAAMAVIVAVILFSVNWGDDPGGGASLVFSGRPPMPVFTHYSEALGFSIDVPRNYLRQASEVSTVSDVVWQAAQPDPAVGTLQVQVQRDDSQPGTTPIDYVSAKERAESADSDDVDYRRLSLTGQADGSAVWEYTHGSADSGDLYHVRSLAIGSGDHIYALTFSLYAQDMSALQVEWQAAQPIMTRIRDSFHLTP